MSCLRLLLVMWVIALLGCSSARHQPTASRLSDEDPAQIEAVIRLETSEPILMLNPNSDDPRNVRVNTGISNKAFNSSGKSFILKKTKSGWTIIFRGTWIS